MLFIPSGTDFTMLLGKSEQQINKLKTCLIGLAKGKTSICVPHEVLIVNHMLLWQGFFFELGPCIPGNDDPLNVHL